MKNTFIVLGLLVTSCGALCLPRMVRPINPWRADQKWPQLLRCWMLGLLRRGNREQPGLSLGIVYDQDLIWAKGYGFADLAAKVPAKPSTVYRIASISKLFTTTAILELRDAGKLQLDDPVAKSTMVQSQERASGRSCNHHPASVDAYFGIAARGRGHELEHLTMPKREEMIWKVGELETVFPPKRNGSTPTWIDAGGRDCGGGFRATLGSVC